MKRLVESVRNFDINSVGPDNSGPLVALRAEVARAVERTFGEDTSDGNRFGQASDISGIHSLILGGGPMSPREYQENVASDIRRSFALLGQAVSSLEGDLQEMAPSSPAQLEEPAREFTNRVFVVHGRDNGPKEAVARFLEGLDIEAIILHEQVSQSRSIIEKIETYGDVDFAVVIMTPDDVGGLVDGAPAPRPRQNVLFELGYFIGKLGRARVCVLRQGDIEMLSDYVGPIWVEFDGAGAWKQTLGQELDAAGFAIDFNIIHRGRR